jgi:hypothetical protein
MPCLISGAVDCAPPLFGGDALMHESILCAVSGSPFGAFSLTVNQALEQALHIICNCSLKIT